MNKRQRWYYTNKLQKLYKVKRDLENTIEKTRVKIQNIEAELRLAGVIGLFTKEPNDN